MDESTSTGNRTFAVLLAVETLWRAHTASLGVICQERVAGIVVLADRNALGLLQVKLTLFELGAFWPDPRLPENLRRSNGNAETFPLRLRLPTAGDHLVITAHTLVHVLDGFTFLLARRLLDLQTPHVVGQWRGPRAQDMTGQTSCIAPATIRPSNAAPAALQLHILQKLLRRLWTFHRLDLRTYRGRRQVGLREGTPSASLRLTADELMVRSACHLAIARPICKALLAFHSSFVRPAP
mmetsp:Transcript_24409/g.56576  ORF Transcript_24409/g.56576 Transcript_24409/m.56576 type:complete len:239 (-) Transcript_24409:349-1065(-)